MRQRLRVSRAGVELIESFEGLRQVAAPLPDGRYTVGYGHTFSAREGSKVTPDDAESLLRFDLLPIMDAVNAAIYVPLNQNQFDALVSFTFNIGIDNFTQSVVAKRINEGRFDEAAVAMDSWRSAEYNGQTYVLAPLIRRRAAEKSLFLTPDDVSHNEAMLISPSPEEGAAPMDEFPTSAMSQTQNQNNNSGLSPEHLRQLMELTNGDLGHPGAPIPSRPYVQTEAQPVNESPISPYSQAYTAPTPYAQSVPTNPPVPNNPYVMTPSAPISSYAPQASLAHEVPLTPYASPFPAQTPPQSTPQMTAMPHQGPYVSPYAIPEPMPSPSLGHAPLAPFSLSSQPIPPVPTPYAPQSQGGFGQEMGEMSPAVLAALREAQELQQRRADEMRRIQESLEREKQLRAELERLEAERRGFNPMGQNSQQPVSFSPVYTPPAHDYEQAARLEAARLEAGRLEAARLEAARLEAVRLESMRIEAERAEQLRLEAERAEQARREAEQAELAQRELAQQEAARQEAARQEAARQEEQRQAEQRMAFERSEALRLEAERAEQQRQEAMRQEAERVEHEARALKAQAEPGPKPELSAEAEAARKAEAAAALMRFYSPYGAPLAIGPKSKPQEAPASGAPKSPFDLSAQSNSALANSALTEPAAVRFEPQPEAPKTAPEPMNTMAPELARGHPYVPDVDVDYTPAMGSPSNLPPPIITAINPYRAEPTPVPTPTAPLVASPEAQSSPVLASTADEGLHWRERLNRPLSPSSQKSQDGGLAIEEIHQPSLLNHKPTAAAFSPHSDVTDVLGHDGVMVDNGNWWRSIVDTLQWILLSGVGIASIGAAIAAYLKSKDPQVIANGNMLQDFMVLAVITASVGLFFVVVSIFIILKRMKRLREAQTA